MKILHITTSKNGGAGISAIRLHKALLYHKYDSKFLVLRGRNADDVFTYKKSYAVLELFLKIMEKIGIPFSWEQRNRSKIRHYKNEFELFSFATTPYKNLHKHPLVKEADVVNLHWVANFIDHETFFRNVKKPIVWTLHDMQPFQGGFHYKNDETRASDFMQVMDREEYSTKKMALGMHDASLLTVVAPSLWLLNLSAQSNILGKFNHSYIPYSIDTTIFKPLNKNDCKNTLGVAREKITVLFVAEVLLNYRKGFDILLEVIKDESIAAKCEFIAVGRVKKQYQVQGIHYLGTVQDEKKMSEIYNAADLFVIPSREDNLPNTMIESLCCGTPVVGFATGGIKDSITNFKNGLLANNISAPSLKKLLCTYIKSQNEFCREEISTAARMLYATENQAKSYISVYRKLLKSKPVFY